MCFRSNQAGGVDARCSATVGASALSLVLSGSFVGVPTHLFTDAALVRIPQGLTLLEYDVKSNNYLDHASYPQYDISGNKQDDRVPKARRESDTTRLFEDGSILRIRIWELAEPVPPSEHRFKYSCFYGRPGERVILYDNERGKGDHRHHGEREEAYAFVDIETLIADFLSDVRRERGEDE